MRKSVRVAVGGWRFELQPVVAVQETRADQVDQLLEGDAGRIQECRDMRQGLDKRGAAGSGAGKSEVPPQLRRSAGDDGVLLGRRAERFGNHGVARAVAAPERAQQLQARHAKVREIRARQGKRLVIGKRQRMDRLPAAVL